FACLSTPLSHAIGSSLSMIFIHALGCEVAELMGNTSQQRIEIPEHTGREINSSGLQAGEGKFRLVRMKGLAHFQKFVVFENYNGQPFIGVWGVAKIVGRYLSHAGEKSFLLRGCADDDGVSSPQGARQKTTVKTSSSVPPTLRFGVFELDPQAGELRKKGMKIRLQGQPVEILAMLLQRPGETITREELQKKLWPADTFVDFEQGVNNAMKQLRASLDDDAESPHFIETLPRHGYRFIGSVNGSKQTRAAEGNTTRSIRLPAFGALAVLAIAAGLV